MKVYKYIKTGQNAISITAGNNAFVKVPLAPEGALSKFVIRQASGTSVAYDVDLFDTGILVEGIHSTALPADAELYRVFPLKQGTSGSTIAEYTTGELGYSYKSMDGASQTKAARHLWLHIRPTASGTTTTWQVTIVVENDIGD